MGSEYKPGAKSAGVIPEAIAAIFARIAAVRDYDCCVRVRWWLDPTATLTKC